MRTPSGLNIRFEHDTGEFPVTRYDPSRARYKDGKRWRRVEQTVMCKHRTICVVERGGQYDDEVEVVTRGVTHCFPEDEKRFEREVGRQVALLKAVKMLPNKSRDGAGLLAAYIQRPGAKPWKLDCNGRVIDREVIDTIANRLASALQRQGLVGLLE